MFLKVSGINKAYLRIGYLNICRHMLIMQFIFLNKNFASHSFCNNNNNAIIIYFARILCKKYKPC